MTDETVRDCVAWAPDPPNNYGAVMAPPGPLTMREHLDLLADRVQTMLDEYEDREGAMRDVARELLQHGMQPDLRHPDAAGAEIVAALEGYLSAIDALTPTTVVPTDDDEEARESVEGGPVRLAQRGAVQLRRAWQANGGIACIRLKTKCV